MISVRSWAERGPNSSVGQCGRISPARMRRGAWPILTIHSSSRLVSRSYWRRPQRGGTPGGPARGRSSADPEFRYATACRRSSKFIRWVRYRHGERRDSPVSIFCAAARSAAVMRMPDHMLTQTESGRIAAAGFSPGRILVVDDDPAVRHLVSDYFAEHGIQTVAAMDRSAVARQLAGGGKRAVILYPPPPHDNWLCFLPQIL